MSLLSHVYRPLTSLIPATDPGHEVKFLVLVSSGSAPTTYKTLFSKILERLGCHPELDIHFLELGETTTCNYLSLLESYRFQSLILCGLSASSIGLQSSLPLHVPVRLNGIYLIRTDAPENLEKASVEVKTAFWNGLKSMTFNACL